MPRHGKSSKPKVRVDNAYARLPLPSGVPVPMCVCGDPCKIAKSEEEETYNQTKRSIYKLQSRNFIVLISSTDKY